jgi:hypothetical protein
VAAVFALTGAALFVVAGLAAAARTVHVGNLDALALAEKLAKPYPTSAVDWPELEILSVIPQPGDPSLVLLLVGRPRFDTAAATLLVQLSGGGGRANKVLSDWCRGRAPIAPTARADGTIELRRRQTLNRVRCRLLAEDSGPAASGTCRRPLSA